MTFRRRSQDRSVTRQISGPGELLQAVPYLLGFHPHRSLVLVGLDARLLAVTARLDLADIESGVVPHTLAAIIRGGATSIVAVVYDDEVLAGASGWPALPNVHRILDESTAAAGCQLLDVLLVARGRWWSLDCEVAECCPRQGRALPSEPSAFTAAATYDGVVALPDREALEAVLAPLPEADRARLEDSIAEAEHAAFQHTVEGHAERYERSAKRRLFAAARASDEPAWTAPPDDEAARLAVALSSDAVRNALWFAVDERRLDGRALWRDLGRRLPSPYDAPALFLFGWAAWRSGDGALAGIAAQRAVQSNVTYTAADLLLAAVRNGVDPRTTPKLRAC